MSLPDFSLRGKLALLTGSAQGLGLVIARAYGHAGAAVIVNGRDPERTGQAAQRLRGEGLEAHAWVRDMAQLHTLQADYAALCDQYGVPDILVNNVGIRMRKTLAEFSLQDIENLMHTDLTAAVYLSKLAAEHMAQAGRAGRLISMSSIADRVARPGDAVYPVAKHGISGLVRALAVEYGRLGITSNGIAPGTFATESNAALARDPVKGPQVLGRNPMQRWAEPEEIAGAALFLASPAASYVNGHVLVVDGGFSITF
jgi:gluconate 5-dehydrogenase